MDILTLNASSDGGNSWIRLASTTRSDSTGFVDFKMFTIQTGYLLTSKQIMKTNDGGKSWQQEYKISSGTLVGLFYLDENHRWVGCTDGIILKYHP